MPYGLAMGPSLAGVKGERGTATDVGRPDNPTAERLRWESPDLERELLAVPV